MKLRRIIWILALVAICGAAAAGAPQGAVKTVAAQGEDPGDGGDGPITLYLPSIQDTTPLQDWIGPFGGKITAITIYQGSAPNTIYVGTWGSGVFKSNNNGQTWTPVNTGLDNLNIQSIAVSTNNRNLVYAGTYRDGVYKTTDGGATWTEKNDGIQDEAIVYAIAVAPGYPQNVMVATRGESNDGDEPWNGSLYKSTDFGEHWDERLDNIGLKDNIDGNDEDWVYSLSFDPDNPNVIYAASHFTGPFWSNDLGNDWEQADPTEDDNDGDLVSKVGRVIAAVDDGDDDGRVYYGAWTDASKDNRGGVFISEDGGRNWSSRRNGIDKTDISGLVVDPNSEGEVYIGSYNNGLFKSTNAGIDWTSINNGFQYTGSIASLGIMDVPNNNQDILFAGTNGDGLYSSTDSGNSWFHTQEGLTGSPISAIVTNPGHPEVVMASFYEGGVFQSTNYGETWTNVTGVDLLNQGIHSLLVNPANLNQVFALTNSKGLRTLTLSSGASADGLETLTAESGLWEPASEGLPTLDVTDAAFGEANRLDEDHPLAGQTLSEDEQLALQEAPEIEAQTIAPSYVPLLSMAFSPTQSGTAYLGTSTKGVFRSTDVNNGVSSNWKQVGLDLHKVYALAVDSSSTPIVYAGTDVPKSLKYSTDSGDHWHDAAMPEGTKVYGLSISPADPTIVYAATSDGLYKSVSGSNIWTQVAFNDVSLNSVQASPKTAGQVIVGTVDGAFYSLDGGTSWISFSSLDNLSIQTLTFDYPLAGSTHYLFMGTKTHGISRITLFH